MVLTREQPSKVCVTKCYLSVTLPLFHYSILPLGPITSFVKPPPTTLPPVVWGKNEPLEPLEYEYEYYYEVWPLKHFFQLAFQNQGSSV